MVVDCSVLSAILFQEDSREDALRIVARRTLHAPLILESEIASVALKKQRGGVPEARIAAGLALFEDQAIELHRPPVQAQYELARRYGLSAYDAGYVWLAGVLQAQLATFDAKLAKAAQKHLDEPG